MVTAAAAGLGLLLVAVVGSVGAAWTEIGVVRRVAGDAARVVAAAGALDSECAVEVRARLGELGPAFELPAVRCEHRGATVSVTVEGTVAIRATPFRIPVRVAERAVSDR